MVYKVKNLKEGGRKAPIGYKSWLEYWEMSVRCRAGKCHNPLCLEEATDGAHVQLENGNGKWWVVPMCHRCNCQFGAHLEVEGPLVSVTDSKEVKL